MPMPSATSAHMLCAPTRASPRTASTTGRTAVTKLSTVRRCSSPSLSTTSTPSWPAQSCPAVTSTVQPSSRIRSTQPSGCRRQPIVPLSASSPAPPAASTKPTASATVPADHATSHLAAICGVPPSVARIRVCAARRNAAASPSRSAASSQRRSASSADPSCVAKCASRCVINHSSGVGACSNGRTASAVMGCPPGSRPG